MASKERMHYICHHYDKNANASRLQVQVHVPVLGNEVQVYMAIWLLGVKMQGCYYKGRSSTKILFGSANVHLCCVI
jgi:hypothetical protein